MKIAATVLVCFVLGGPQQARGTDKSPEHTIRIATLAPDGSAWAREFKAFAREVNQATSGEVLIKVYFGGAAGDEPEMIKRVGKQQLDGMLGGSMCHLIMPTFRSTGLVGTFNSRAEATYVVSELRPILDEEAQAAGFALLTTAGIGATIIFSREPIDTMQALRASNLWQWNTETVMSMMFADMGIEHASLPVADAAKAYDEGKTNGFFSGALAAVAFQWHALPHYFTDLNTSYLMGCFVLANRALDGLSTEQAAVVREAAAKLGVRIEEVGAKDEAALLGGIFEKHGLKKVPVSTKFRAEFFEAARVARKRLGEKLVPKATLDKVLQLLADYRAEHAD